MNSPFRTTVGLRGRVTVPSAIQADAGIGVGDTVVVSAEGPGVVVIRTLQAIKDSIRAGNPEGYGEDREDADAAE